MNSYDFPELYPGLIFAINNPHHRIIITAYTPDGQLVAQEELTTKNKSHLQRLLYAAEKWLKRNHAQNKYYVPVKTRRG